MEINNFVSMEFLAGFAGTLIGVELIVTCTKEVPIVKKIPTKMYTFILALIHLLIVKYAMGTLKFSLGNLYLLVINSFLVSIILCSGYDVALGNISIPQIVNGEKKNIKLKGGDTSQDNVSQTAEEVTVKKSINTGIKTMTNPSKNLLAIDEDNVSQTAERVTVDRSTKAGIKTTTNPSINILSVDEDDVSQIAEGVTEEKSINTTINSTKNSLINSFSLEEENICLSNRGRNSNLNDKIT